MWRLEETDVWYRTYDVRNDARFTYALSENDPLTLFTDPNRKSNSKPDPLNSRRFATGQTYVELPDAPAQPWVQPLPAAMSGKVERASASGRDVWVYTPTGSSTTGKRLPLVVLMAGSAYFNFTSVPATLDHLIAERRIQPVVAVGVAGGNNSLTCSPEYASFLADQLVPWMRNNYHATGDPKQTVIGGSSLGGLAATFTAFTHPEVFGKAFAQSGSFWWKRVYGSREKPDDTTDTEWLTRQIAAAPRVPVQFFLEAA